MLKALDEIRKTNKQIPEPDPYKFDTWCNGNPFYEQAGPGDGLNLAFFPNEAFEGESTKDKGLMLDFAWSGKKPHPKIPSDNFSVIISGFIKPPLEDKYKFTIMTSGAV